MKDLSDFLQVEEGVEFIFTNPTKLELKGAKLKIKDNILLIKRERDRYFGEACLNINELINLNIEELPKPTLTEWEKHYLKNVIEPVKDVVVSVSKDYGKELHLECIIIELMESNDKLSRTGEMYLYDFDKGTEFQGMEFKKTYTLEELGLYD